MNNFTISRTFGYALNPSDNNIPDGKNKIVFSNTVNKVDLDADVENSLSKSRKQYKEDWKKKR